MTFLSSTTNESLETNLRKYLPSVGVFLFFGFVTLLPEFAGIAHAATTATAPAAPATQATNAGNGFWGWALGGAFGGVAQLIFSLAGFLFGLVGMLFNWAVVLTVFQFGSYFGNSAGMLIAWGVLRDIGNIILLFGFIFMGILMILDLDHGGSKKAIPGLIIFAILLNFSLFASEAIVDVSNVLSASIFNQAGQCTSVSGCGLTAAAASGTAATTNTGISGVIMSTLGLGTLFNPSSANIQALAHNGTQGVLFLIGSAIFITIAMVVLLAGSIMLFIRAITLVFLLVVSPIGFAAMAIPPLSGMANRWWKLLISQAFFAPVFLLLILVSVKILSGIGTQTGSGSSMSFADAIANPSSSNVGIFLIFGLMIGFFIAALLVAKSLGAIGADYATSVATKTVRGTIATPFRIAGAPIYRNTIGRGAAGLSELQTKPGIVGGIARSLNVATSGGLQSGLKKAQGSSFLGTQSYDDRKKLIQHTEHDKHIAHSKQEVRDGLKMNNAIGDAKVEKALQSMSQEDYEKELENATGAARAKLSKLVSADRAQKTMDSKTFHGKSEFMQDRYGDVISAATAFKTFKPDPTKTAADNAAAKAALFKTLKEKTGELADKEADLIAKNLTDTFETLSTAVNETGDDPAETAWTNSQREHLTKSEILIKSQKTAIKDTARHKLLERAIDKNDSATAAKIYVKMSGKEAGEVAEDKVFADGPGGTKVIRNIAAQVFVDNINPERMKGIMAKEKWSEPAKEALRSHWEARGRANPKDPEYLKIRKHLNGNAGSYWGTLP